jgi:hypothetical protein
MWDYSVFRILGKLKVQIITLRLLIKAKMYKNLSGHKKLLFTRRVFNFE